MKKFFTQKAFLLITLLFISMAAFSFAAFRETRQDSRQATKCCKLDRTAPNSDLLWEVVSRQFLSLISL